jgi:hypothetical protein
VTLVERFNGVCVLVGTVITVLGAAWLVAR